MVSSLSPENDPFAPPLKHWAEAVLLSTARVNNAALFPPLYKNGAEGIVTQLRPSTSHILMWGVREQEGHPLYPMTALP